MKNVLLTMAIILQAFASSGQSVDLKSEVIWAEKMETGDYEISTKLDQDLVIYSGVSAGNIKWQEPIKLHKGEKLKIANPTGTRLFFGLVMEEDTLVFSERRIAMKGTPNFRDLGGIRTESGRTVKWNKIFRCGDLGKLDDTDLALMNSFRINTIIDFRREDEISRSPDRYPHDADIKWINTAIGSSNPTSIDGFYKVLLDANSSKETMDSVFMLYYKNIAGSLADYKPLFQELIKNELDDALLFHCTAGKDRTGVASALILYTLGVTEETIMDEYYLSNRYTQDIFKDGELSMNIKPEVLQVLASVKQEYLKATFDEINLRYGSIDRALEIEADVDKYTKERLKEIYTY